jgi:hypothetical protein
MKGNLVIRNVVGWLFLVLALTGCTASMKPQPQDFEANDAGVQPINFKLQATALSRSEELTTLFNAAYLEQDRYQRDDVIHVNWPAELDQSSDMVIRIQTASGRIYLEKNFSAKANAVANLGKAYLIPAGEYEIVLMPPTGEYYFGDLRIDHKLAITLLP